MNKDAETAEEQNNVSTNDTPTGKVNCFLSYLFTSNSC